MNNNFRHRARKSPLPSLSTQPDASSAPTFAKDDIDSEFQFTAMAVAYARHGGMPHADEVVEWLRCRRDQPLSVLARWIVSHELITIDWHHHMLIPMFQIDPCSSGLRPGCREIIAELKDVMDDWELAQWFATSNPWLGGLAPVDMLALSWREVFNAARVARFIARG